MNVKLLQFDATTQLAIRQHVNEAAPSTVVTYLLWLLLGWVGAQYFYLSAKAAQGHRMFYFVWGVICLCTFNFAGFGWLLDAFANLFHIKYIKDTHEDVIIEQFKNYEEACTKGAELAKLLNSKPDTSDKTYDDHVWTGKGV